MAESERHCLRTLETRGSKLTRCGLNAKHERYAYLCLVLFPALLLSQHSSDLRDTAAVQDTPAAKVTAPKLLYKLEPEYTEAARRAGVSGKALLSIVVDVDGHPKNIRVVSPLSAGLAEEAIKAVSKWRFEPATRKCSCSGQGNGEGQFPALC